MYKLLPLVLVLVSCESKITEIVPPKDLWWLLLFGGVFLGVAVYIVIEEVRNLIVNIRNKRKNESNSSRRKGL